MSRVLYQWKVFCEMKVYNWIAFTPVECKKNSLCLGIRVFELTSVRRYLSLVLSKVAVGSSICKEVGSK